MKYKCMSCFAGNKVRYEKSRAGQVINIKCVSCGGVQKLRLPEQRSLRLKYYGSSLDTKVVDLDNSKTILSNIFFQGEVSETHAYIDLPDVEKDHCVISRINDTQDDQYFLVDLNSDKGVSINNEKLQAMKSYKIETKDIIKIGTRRFLVF